MKIGVFTTAFPPNVGGIETVLDLLCHEFVALGHQVRVLTSARGAGEYPFEVARQPDLSTVLKTVAWCDVLLQANVSLRWVWLLGIARSKLIFQHHTPYELDDGTIPLEERTKRLLAKVVPGVAVSSFVGETIGVKHVIPNPYNSERYTLSQSQGRTHDLAFLGRLVSQKGCDILIKALVILKASGKERRLSVIGDGPERPKLERMVIEVGLERQVQFLGTVTGEELSRLLNQHEIIVVPSICREAFGMVVLEGLACGCRPVVSLEGGLLEASGPFGIPFPNGDAAKLALAIDSLSEENVNRLSKKQIDTHLSNFSPRAVASKYVHFFQSRIGS